MDLYCPKCREPWDNDSLHEEVQARVEHAGYEGLPSDGITYSVVYREFTEKGCSALITAFGAQDCNSEAPSDAGLAALYEFAGDDSDFAASLASDYDSYMRRRVL